MYFEYSGSVDQLISLLQPGWLSQKLLPEINKTEKMEKSKSGFRNNSPKCWFNDVGYCKFKEECKKEHSFSVCQNKSCDKKCQKRHPKECKYKDECKFLQKGICSFSHDYNNAENENLESRMKALEESFAISKGESEAKIKHLEEEMEKIRKDFVNKNEILQRNLEKENSKLKEEINKLKIDNGKAVNVVNDKCKKLIKDAIAENTKSVQETVDKTLNLFKANFEVQNNSANTEKQNQKNTDNQKKLKKSKIKELKENRILQACEKDCHQFGELRDNCGLDVRFKICKKCDFETHSEYLLRLHQERVHKIKQTFQNLVLGYECDLKSHIEVLIPMEEEIDNLNCTECDFKSCTEGKIEMHKTEYHEELYMYAHQG